MVGCNALTYFELEPMLTLGDMGDMGHESFTQSGFYNVSLFLFFIKERET